MPVFCLDAAHNYLQHLNKQCSSLGTHNAWGVGTHDTFAAAKAACDGLGSGCTGLNDNACDHAWFTICTGASFATAPSSSSGCAYEKRTSAASLCLSKI